jgi:hypothetical protein
MLSAGELACKGCSRALFGNHVALDAGERRWLNAEVGGHETWGSVFAAFGRRCRCALRGCLVYVGPTGKGAPYR